jgi:hypothetical protein
LINKPSEHNLITKEGEMQRRGIEEAGTSERKKREVR